MASTGIDLTSLFSNLGQLGSAGMSAANQQQNYGVLQDALKNVGPTQLGNFSLAGPGGANASFSGGNSSVNLGALNPAYNGFAQYATDTMNGHSAINGAISGTQPFLGAAGQQLTAAGQGYNPGLQQSATGAAQTQINGLNSTYDQVYGNSLANLRANAAPQNLIDANHLQDTMFGNGQLGSSSGGLLATAFGKGLGQADASYQLSAQQAAQSAQQNQLGLASGLSGISNNAATIGQNQLNSAFSNFSGINSLYGNLNTSNLNNAISATQGATNLNTNGLNSLQAALQPAQATASAKNGSLSSYSNLAQALAGTPNASTLLANALGGALGGQQQTGGSGSNLLTQLGSLYKSGSSAYSSLFGSGSSGGMFGSGATALGGASLGAPYDFSSLFGSGVSDSTLAGNLGSDSSIFGDFSGAGGQAASGGSSGGAADAFGAAAGATDAAAAGGLSSFGSGAAANAALADAGFGGATSVAPIATSGAAAGGSGAAAGGTAAASGGSSGAAAGSLAGGAVGLGILAAPAIAGMMTSGVQTNAAYAQKLNDHLFSNNPDLADSAMGEMLAAQNDKDNRVTITPAQQQRINQLIGIGSDGTLDRSKGLLNQMRAADPRYQGKRAVNKKGVQIQ